MNLPDPDLEQSLRATFRAHEYLADGRPPEAPPSGPRQRIRSASAAVVAASVLVCVVVGAVYWQNEGQRYTPKPLASAAQPADHIAVTRTKLADLMAAAVLPPDAAYRDAAPVADLTGPAGAPGTTNVLTETRWFIAPGTPVQASAYLVAHAPAQLRYRGPTGSVASGGTVRTDLTFIDPQEDSSAYTAVQLTVSLVETSIGIAGRVDTQAVWLPIRGPNTQVPLPVTSVDVIHQSAAGGTTSQTFTGDQARALATIVNSARAANPGVRSCPAQVGTPDSERLTFHSAGGAAVELVVRFEACPVAYVEVAGRVQQPPLDPETITASLRHLHR